MTFQIPVSVITQINNRWFVSRCLIVNNQFSLVCELICNLDLYSAWESLLSIRTGEQQLHSLVNYLMFPVSLHAILYQQIIYALLNILYAWVCTYTAAIIMYIHPFGIQLWPSDTNWYARPRLVVALCCGLFEAFINTLFSARSHLRFEWLLKLSIVSNIHQRVVHLSEF